jgi:hypothetical protein
MNHITLCIKTSPLTVPPIYKPINYSDCTTINDILITNNIDPSNYKCYIIQKEYPLTTFINDIKEILEICTLMILLEKK